jgi:hypothetical protein
MSLYVISPDMLDNFWHLARPLLKPAVDVAANIHVDELYPEIKSGQKVMVIGYDEDFGLYGAAVVTTVQHTRKKTLLIEYLGTVPNTMNKFLADDMNTFKEWALFDNCDSIEIHGRVGWERALKDFGCKVTRCICDIDLKG